VAELARIRGLGDAKAVRLKAALELGRRLAAFSDDPPKSGTPDDVGHVPPPLIGPQRIEVPSVLSRVSPGWRFGEAARRPPQPPHDARDFCAICLATRVE
jgi:hypothetical protein